MTERTIGLIPGTGKQSRGIALRLGLAGFKVFLGSRSEERAQIIANELNTKLGKKQFKGMLNSSVAKQCNLLFLVVPPENLVSILNNISSEITSGTIIVDVVVPLCFEKGLAFSKIDVIDGDLSINSISEYIQSRVPADVTVVGAFKTISAAKLNDILSPLDVDVFLTSDNNEAKIELKELLQRINGLRALDAGPLAFSKITEQMTALVINLNKLNKLKHASFKVLSI